MMKVACQKKKKMSLNAELTGIVYVVDLRGKLCAVPEPSVLLQEL